MPQSRKNNKVRNKETYFWFQYTNGSHDKLLKKFKGNISNLNEAIKTATFNFIEKNKNSSYNKTRKAIYLSSDENSVISQFCIKKNISRAQLAELIKNEFNNNNT